MNGTQRALLTWATLVGLSAPTGLAVTQAQADALEQGFRNPPDSAKPRVWWHWTGGNVTKEGITKDLEWMKRIGIGGAQAADIGMGGGQTIDKPINFFSDAWFDAIKHAASECDRLTASRAERSEARSWVIAASTATSAGADGWMLTARGAVRAVSWSTWKNKQSEQVSICA